MKTIGMAALVWMWMASSPVTLADDAFSARQEAGEAWESSEAPAPTVAQQKGKKKDKKKGEEDEEDLHGLAHA